MYSPLLINCAASKQQLLADSLFCLLRVQTTKTFSSWSLNKLEVFKLRPCLSPAAFPEPQHSSGKGDSSHTEPTLSELQRAQQSTMSRTAARAGN